MTEPHQKSSAGIGHDWTASEDTQGPNGCGYYTAGIDIPIVGEARTRLHYAAIEFHAKDRAEAERRRDAVLAALTATEPQAAPVLDREVLHQAAKEGNLQYWRDAEKQRSAFDEWRLAGYVGDCPQFAKGSVVDYITDAILATLSLPRPNPQTPD